MKKNHIYTFKDTETNKEFIGFLVQKDIFLDDNIHTLDYMLFSVDSSYNIGIEKSFKKVSPYFIENKEISLMDFHKEYKKELEKIEDLNIKHNLLLNWMDKNQMAFALKKQYIKEDDIINISSKCLLSFSCLT